MKTISARQFRVEFASLTEAVTVLRREPSGNFAVLGTWTPQKGSMSAGTAAFIDEHFGSPSPAPKKGAAK